MVSTFSYDTVEQKIMLQLQQRAHYSLEESRRGHTIANRYPVGSEPVSPDHDNDELAILGGKTRLVANIELPSSPNLMERSPNSHNPIVPLPLSPTMHHHMDPSVVEYLHSFGPPVVTHSGGGGVPSEAGGNQMSAQQPSAGFSAEVELSPVSVYGMTSMSTPTSYGTQDSLTYMSSSSPTHPHRRVGSLGHHHQQQQHQHQQHQQHSGSSHDGGNSFCDVTMGSSTTTNPNPVVVSSFPQYFPVFDYGSGMMNGNGNGGMASTTTATTAATVGGGGGYGDAPILDTPSPSGGGQQQQQQQRKASGSPEGNMQSMWQDFVMGLQMTT